VLAKKQKMSFQKGDEGTREQLDKVDWDLRKLQF
jgi:hypothetical protein